MGCFVLNEAGEVLLVQEKSGPLRGLGVWKMVTGLVDAGEDIVEAAAREACMRRLACVTLHAARACIAAWLRQCLHSMVLG